MYTVKFTPLLTIREISLNIETSKLHKYLKTKQTKDESRESSFSANIYFLSLSLAHMPQNPLLHQLQAMKLKFKKFGKRFAFRKDLLFITSTLIQDIIKQFSNHISK